MLEDKLNIFSGSNFKDFKSKVSQTDRDALQVLELNDQEMIKFTQNLKNL